MEPETRCTTLRVARHLEPETVATWLASGLHEAATCDIPVTSMREPAKSYAESGPEGRTAHEVIICDGQVWLMPCGRRLRTEPGGMMGLWLCQAGDTPERVALDSTELRAGTLVAGPRDVTEMMQRGRDREAALRVRLAKTGSG